MRELKFRAWWKDAKIMVDVRCVRFEGGIEFFVPVKSGEKSWNELQVLDDKEQYELMQYTGLEDKNGKEIYEGDIVRDEQRKEENITAVEWNDEHAMFTGCLAGRSNHGLIIGNIYENGELLK